VIAPEVLLINLNVATLPSIPVQAVFRTFVSCLF
jgi:hypothetical protein